MSFFKKKKKANFGTYVEKKCSDPKFNIGERVSIKGLDMWGIVRNVSTVHYPKIIPGTPLSFIPVPHYYSEPKYRIEYLDNNGVIQSIEYWESAIEPYSKEDI